jgi:hypothetical protein
MRPWREERRRELRHEESGADAEAEVAADGVRQAVGEGPRREAALLGGEAWRRLDVGGSGPTIEEPEQ